MTTFIIDALDFLHLTEYRAVIRSDVDFEGAFEGVVCPLFMLLHRKLTMFAQFTPKQVSKVKEKWQELTLLYVQTKNPQ